MKRPALFVLLATASMDDIVQHQLGRLVFTLDCDPALAWRIDEGDAFELLGNLMDNAVKWMQKQAAGIFNVAEPNGYASTGAG